MKYIYLIGALLLVNIVASTYYCRLDMTQERRYTLSDVTKQYLAELDSQVFIRIYLDGQLNPGFSRLQRSTCEMVDEMRAQADVSFSRVVVDPHELSEREFERFNDKLADNGLAGIPVFETKEDGQKTRTVVYPFALVQVGSRQMFVNLLENQPGLSGEENLGRSVENLEYKLINAIRRLSVEHKPRVAFIEGHGELDEVDVVDAADALSAHFAVDRGAINGDLKILEPYKAVIIAKPTQMIPEADKYVLDQYIMHGGRVLWMIDAVAMTLDSLRTSPQTIGLLHDCNLDDQLFVYGYRVNPVVVEDMSCSMVPISVNTQGNNQIVPMPWHFSPLFSANNRHSVTKGISLVRGDFTSTIDTVGVQDERSPIRRVPLLRTSAYTRVNRTPIMATLMTIHEKADPAEFKQQHLPVAVLSEGTFKSSFTRRPIPSGVRNAERVDRREVSETTKMIVVGDGDIIRNEVRFRNTASPQVTPLGYDEMSRQTFGNKDFIVNAIQYLADDDGLMQLRNRTFQLRLLDKARIAQGTTLYKVMAFGVPILFVVVFGIAVVVVRRVKFSYKREAK
ncbi:MAG: gliding motility-associated ABC transporter substrate-binding protein GldG [Marinilabiliaceae bacterium]|nr:gliding motility-associated ABC transporter substrate-binding protein GldG [Marinilabiliaceae bacterium]